ncbi:hypothetical protein JTE90_006214 [Oedothorax gibbosus]|uniref:Neurotransmitter-gated ion-channel ligand-binding domain-containing protein n=1 Tax=Oedothorax gibbosus TaxID=931172 RepID=A0AAV6VV39_9ARAC|nr:hypothetical protein JTE90_006214 [Oedothorax gibbosus]
MWTGKYYEMKIPMVFVLCVFVLKTECNPDAKRLYDDLMSGYNRLIRPVVNNSDTLTVKLGLKLSQLIDVNLRNQIMTTNVWVNQIPRNSSLVKECFNYRAPVVRSLWSHSGRDKAPELNTCTREKETGNWE